MLWCSLAVARVPTLQSDCAPDLLYVCVDNVTGLHVKYTSQPPQDILDACQQCNENNCSTPPRANGVKGFPSQASCALCGDPVEMDTIGENYSIHVRHNCDSVALCKGDVRLSVPVVLSDRGSVRLTGNPATKIVAEQCPAFIFKRLTGLEVDGITIECNGVAPGYEATVPGIVVENSRSMLLRVKSLKVSNKVLSSLLVMGGDFDVVPVIASTEMNGSFVSNVVVQDSEFPNPVAVTMSDFVGTVDVDGMPQFSKLMIAPGKGGRIKYSNTALHLAVNDPSVFTQIFGTPYESEFVANRDLYGYTSQEINNTGRRSLLILSFIFLGLVSDAFGVGMRARVHDPHHNRRDCAF